MCGGLDKVCTLERGEKQVQVRRSCGSSRTGVGRRGWDGQWGMAGAVCKLVGCRCSQAAEQRTLRLRRLDQVIAQ